MSDENTYNTDGEVDTLDDKNFDEQYVPRDDYDKAMKKATDQEKARKRLEGENKELKAKVQGTGTGEDEDGGEGNPAPQDTSTAETADGLSEIQIVRLETRGITDPKEMEVYQKAIARGMTFEEALNDDFVKGRVESMRQEKKVEQATDVTGQGGSEAVSTEDAIIREFKKTGQIPDKEGAATIISAAAKADTEVYNKLVTG